MVLYLNHGFAAPQSTEMSQLDLALCRAQHGEDQKNISLYDLHAIIHHSSSQQKTFAFPSSQHLRKPKTLAVSTCKIRFSNFNCNARTTMRISISVQISSLRKKTMRTRRQSKASSVLATHTSSDL